MTKLSDITGYAENWPKKHDLTEPITLHDGSKAEEFSAYFQDGKQRGFNQLHDQTSSLGIGIDVKEVALIIQDIVKQKGEDVNYGDIAKSIAANPQKFLRIEKASHE